MFTLLFIELITSPHYQYLFTLYHNSHILFITKQKTERQRISLYVTSITVKLVIVVKTSHSFRLPLHKAPTCISLKFHQQAETSDSGISFYPCSCHILNGLGKIKNNI